MFVDRFKPIIHLVTVPESITSSGCTRLFIDTFFRLHRLSRELVSNRDLLSTAVFWRSVLKMPKTRLKMSTSDHHGTDGQKERANRDIEEILRGYVHYFTHLSNLCRRWNLP